MNRWLFNQLPMQVQVAFFFALVVLVIIGAFITIVQHSSDANGFPDDTITSSVVGNRMTANTLDVKQGNLVSMTVTANRAEDIYLQGYDLDFSVPEAGGFITHKFRASRDGLFVLEIEPDKTYLGAFQVGGSWHVSRCSGLRSCP